MIFRMVRPPPRLVERTIEKLADWYRDRNRARYLSGFERWRNRSMWTLLLIALAYVVVYAVVQHVVFAPVADVFRGETRLGVVFYDLAIAYIGAFGVYALNVRLPLRRDRRNVYQFLAPLIGRVVDEAVDLMTSLNTAAGVDPQRPNSWRNVRDTCERIRPDLPAGVRVKTASGYRQGNVIDVIALHMDRAREVNREILRFSTFLAPELIKHVVAVEEHGYFQRFDNLSETGQLDQLTDMSAMAPEIFDYLQLVDHVDDYCQAFLATERRIPPELIAGTERQSDAIPLRRAIKSAGPEG